MRDEALVKSSRERKHNINRKEEGQCVCHFSLLFFSEQEFHAIYEARMNFRN